MRTKQLRLNDSAQIRKRMPEFLGKKINVVLNNRTVVFGELQHVDEAKVVVKNMRLEKMTIPYDVIVEIYLDSQVPC